MAGPTIDDLRRRSRFEVLRGIYHAGATSRQALAADGRWSFATVSKIVARLLELGVVVETSYESDTGGRPRARLEVNPRRGALVGVSVSEGVMRVALFDLALREIHRVRRALPWPGIGADELIEAIAGTVTPALTAREGLDVLGVGVSIPGEYTPHNAEVAPLSPVDRVVRAKLGEALGLPVTVDNPLKAATIAELWTGTGHGASDLVVVTLGGGVGVGLAPNGTLLRGFTDTAGEWGHTTVDVDGPVCRCGARGCLEAYLGAPALLRRWYAARGRTDGVAGSLHEWNGDDLYGGIVALGETLRDGDPLATRLIAEAGRYLGVGLANLINLVNPDTVVLGGFVTDVLGDWLIPYARVEAAARCLPRTFESLRLLRSPVGTTSTCLGMATVALERFIRDAG